MLFNLHIFNRQGKCLYFVEWNSKRSKQLRPDQEQKLMFGLLFSLKQFVQQITPAQLDETQRENFTCLTSKGYRLHYMESLSGLRFVILSDPSTADCQPILRRIYELFVEHILKNGFHGPEEAADCKLFLSALNQYVTTLSCFS